MDVRRLGYFLAVVDQGDSGRAAEHPLTDQPSLSSEAVASLEHELGVQLFHRVGRGVVLSDAGRQLVEPARRVLRDVEAARAVIDSVQGLQRGRIHLVTTPSPGIEPLATLTASVRESHPGLVVDVAAAFTRQEVVESVRTGTTELGLLGTPGPVRTPDLSVVHLGNQPLVLVSPAGSDLPDTVQPDDLDDQPMVVSQPGSLIRTLVDDLLAGETRMRITAQVAHRTSILPLVLAGVGHAVVPASWTALARGAGAEVRTLRRTIYLNVSLISRSDGLSPAAQAFVDAARTYARQVS